MINESAIRKALVTLKLVAAAIIIIGIAAMSVYTIREQEQAVIVTFGVPSTVATPGLHFKVPFIQQRHMVPMVINSFAIGYDAVTNAAVEAESLMITSDYNFVNVDFFVEYRVSDPVKYLYASSNPVQILRMMTLSYIRDTIGLYPVDSVITTGKNEIQSEIRRKIMDRLAKEDIGLQLINITIQDATPPTEEVFEAFKAVETAKQGKETAINNANKYRSEEEPAALAKADSITKVADAQKQSRINEALGQVARFNSIYAEYEKNPAITKQRMYYEAMEEILPGLKIVIDDGGSTSKMLPLESFTNQREGE